MPLKWCNRARVACLSTLAEVYSSTGNLLFKVSLKSVADNFYNAALNFDAKNYKALTGKGRIEILAENTMKAILLFKDAIAARPELPHAYKGLGDAYRQLKNYEKAECYYKESLEQKEDYLPAKLSLILTCIESKQLKTAKAMLEEFEFKDVLVQTLYGLLYIEKQQYEKALDIFQALLKKYPAEVEYVRLLGSIYHAQDRLDEGIQYFNQYCKKHKAYDVLFLMAAAYDAKGEHEKASEIYKKALELAPDSEIIIHRLGLQASVNGDYARAVELLEHQIQLRPRTPLSIRAFYSLAYAEMCRNNFEKAIYWFEKCIAEDYNKIDSYQWLIDIYEKLGDEVSMARYKKLLDKDWYGIQ